MLTGVEKAVGNVDKTINNGTVKTVVTNIDQLKSSSDKATKSAKKLAQYHNAPLLLVSATPDV